MWTGDIYAKYPKPEDGERLRYSDDAYAGYSHKGHLWIARKRGTAIRYRWDNIQHRSSPPEKKPAPGTRMGCNWV